MIVFGGYLPYVDKFPGCINHIFTIVRNNASMIYIFLFQLVVRLRYDTKPMHEVLQTHLQVKRHLIYFLVMGSFNSLIRGWFGCNLKNVMFNFVLLFGILGSDFRMKIPWCPCHETLLMIKHWSRQCLGDVTQQTITRGSAHFDVAIRRHQDTAKTIYVIFLAQQVSRLKWYIQRITYITYTACVLSWFVVALGNFTHIFPEIFKGARAIIGWLQYLRCKYENYICISNTNLMIRNTYSETKRN